MIDEDPKPSEDGAVVETEPKEIKEKPRVSFNREIHVKRFGKPRESRGTSETPSVRKEPFTHLSEKELIEEANKVLAAAKSVTCTADNPPEKFFSLPHRRKFKETRRNSDDTTPEGKIPLGRSTSDVSSRKRRERTSLSTLFRKSHNNKSPNDPVVVTTKPVAVVKRSKSDVTDLKSNTNLNTQNKPIRKRSGSETEEFLKSLRNKKTQLSPIIESSPREDYFKNTPPLEAYQKNKSTKKENKSEDLKKAIDSKKVNPVEKPPRFKTPEKQDPKPPTRNKRGKSLEKEKEKEKSPSVTETPKRKTEVKKSNLVDEIDSKKPQESPVEVKDKIKESIRKIEENVYGSKDMIHSSQQPPDKPPLTRGHTVDHIVKILKEDQFTPPSKTHIIAPNGDHTNQPFSYIKSSVSPDPNQIATNPSPDRPQSPADKMNGKGIVYAQVVRDSERLESQAHKTYSPTREKYNFSDEDEGYEEKHKFNNTRMYDYDYKIDDNENFNSLEGYKITDSPIKPRFREYKLRSFEEFEPTYSNEYPSNKEKSQDFIDTFRGRADGMDTKKKQYETEHTKLDLDFNELSHRRQLLESRLNARRYDRERITKDAPITRYLETDPAYEEDKRMKATERFVNETVKYCRNTVERDGFAESSITEDYSKYDSDNHKVKYNTESRTFQKVPKGDTDRREFIDRLDTRYRDGRKVFPPEPEYEPPSLESNISKPVLTPDEYKEKKYKAKKHLASSHDILQTGQKYKVKDDWTGKRKGHYASNPEIAQEREEEYANLPRYPDSYNSLRIAKGKERYKKDFTIRRHDSGDSRDYYRDDRSPRRFDVDNRLVDSGIENDFRKDSSGEIHRKHRRQESDDDVRNISLFLDSERRHTEENYPSEQIYANGDYLARFKEYREGYKKEYAARDRSADDGSRYEKLERYEKSPSRLEDKVSAKPPKATKKLSGLEKMKQLFSRDSSKKSKKEKEPVQQKTRTRVLKSPEHLANDDSEYRRYTDPEPSDIIVRKVDYECKSDERRYKSSKEDLDRDYKTDERRYRNSREDLDRDYKVDERRYRSPKEEESRFRSPKEEEIRYRSPKEEESRFRSLKEDESRFRSLKEEESRFRNPKEEESRFRSPKEEESRFRSPKEEESRFRSLKEDEIRYRTPKEDVDRDNKPDERRYRSSREDLDRYRGTDPRDSDVDRKYRESDNDGRYNRTVREERRFKERKEVRRYNSSERESDHHSRPSDGESELRKSRSRTAGPMDSPALAERYRERRRLATPSPTPSPPPRQASRQTQPQITSGNWFKSLDRLTRKRGKVGKVEKESTITTEDESTKKSWSKPTKPLNSPAKNLRFFGDTDPDSDANVKPSVSKSKSHPQTRAHGTLRKTISSSSNGIDQVDSHLSAKSYSLSSLHREEKEKESPRTKQYYKRNLQNISEIQSNSENESQIEKKVERKPPIPYDRSRSHSSSKTLKGSKADLRRRTEDRGSSSDLRSSKPEISREVKPRHRTPVANSAESSTEGDSSHQSQRSVVYLHATTVGDIPDPGRLSRNRSRDDVSSINSSNVQVRSTTKSFSIFAPWTPKHYNDQYDVHYAQKPRKTTKETVKKASSTKTLTEERPSLQKNKSYSQTTLARRTPNSRLTSSNTTLHKKTEKRRENSTTLRKSTPRDGKKSQSSEIISDSARDRDRVSRSVSMPKDNNKKAGWFKLSSKNKKPEVNSRVR